MKETNKIRLFPECLLLEKGLKIKEIQKKDKKFGRMGNV